MQDPLNVNVPLAGVETDLPLLPEADYPLQIVESTIDANKKNTGLNWNIKAVTTAPVTAVDGRDVKPNFPLFFVAALQPSEESKDPEAFKRTLGETVDAIFGTDKTNRPDFSRATVQDAVGKVVVAHVIIDEYMGRKSNKIRRFKKQQTQG